MCWYISLNNITLKIWNLHTWDPKNSFYLSLVFNAVFVTLYNVKAVQDGISSKTVPENIEPRYTVLSGADRRATDSDVIRTLFRQIWNNCDKRTCCCKQFYFLRPFFSMKKFSLGDYELLVWIPITKLTILV